MFPGSYVPRVLCGGGGGVSKWWQILPYMLAYSGICWHIVTHMNVDISWLMNMLTPIGISVGVKLPNAIIWYQIP